MPIKRQGKKQVDLPHTTTAKRANVKGRIQFNTTTNLAEYYTGTAWKSIDSPPVITSFTLDGGSSVTSASIDASAGGNATIVISGSLFDTTGAVVTFQGTSETLSTASITRDSANQLTCTVARSGFDNSNEPYKIVVTNGSGLSASLASALTQSAPPSFGTAADTILGNATTSGYTQTGSNTPVATDADGDTVTHTISAGSLPTGISMATNGSFSGSVTAGSGAGTSTFTVSATDGVAAAVTRQFRMTFTDAYDIDYLVVAGGGGGGSNGHGGGGGGGGFRHGTYSVAGGTVLTTTVGTGGTSSTSSGNSKGTQGNSSQISGSGLTTITSAGGGGGGTQNGGGQVGGNGGSGGGGEGNQGAGGSGNTPNTTPSQGNDGSGGSGQSPNYGSGAGGGAGQSGGSANSSTGGSGGNGAASSITGSSVTYAGGGGGATYQGGTAGSGGSGGGAAGKAQGGNADAGTNYLGGGGGGAERQPAGQGGNGGIGVVILSMATSRYTGTVSGSPTVTTSGSNTIVKFTGSGSYTA